MDNEKVAAPALRMMEKFAVCNGWISKTPAFLGKKRGVEETLPYRIVSAIVDLERYRGAGRRAELSKTEQRLTAHQRKLLVAGLLRPARRIAGQRGSEHRTGEL